MISQIRGGIITNFHRVRVYIKEKEFCFTFLNWNDKIDKKIKRGRERERERFLATYALIFFNLRRHSCLLGVLVWGYSFFLFVSWNHHRFQVKARTDLFKPHFVYINTCQFCLLIISTVSFMTLIFGQFFFTRMQTHRIKYIDTKLTLKYDVCVIF